MTKFITFNEDTVAYLVEFWVRNYNLEWNKYVVLCLMLNALSQYDEMN